MTKLSRSQIDSEQSALSQVVCDHRLNDRLEDFFDITRVRRCNEMTVNRLISVDRLVEPMFGLNDTN